MIVDPDLEISDPDVVDPDTEQSPGFLSQAASIPVAVAELGLNIATPIVSGYKGLGSVVSSLWDGKSMTDALAAGAKTVNDVGQVNLVGGAKAAGMAEGTVGENVVNTLGHWFDQAGHFVGDPVADAATKMGLSPEASAFLATQAHIAVQGGLAFIGGKGLMKGTSALSGVGVTAKKARAKFGYDEVPSETPAQAAAKAFKEKMEKDGIGKTTEPYTPEGMGDIEPILDENGRVVGTKRATVEPIIVDPDGVAMATSGQKKAWDWANNTNQGAHAKRVAEFKQQLDALSKDSEALVKAGLAEDASKLQAQAESVRTQLWAAENGRLSALEIEALTRSLRRAGVIDDTRQAPITDFPPESAPKWVEEQLSRSKDPTVTEREPPATDTQGVTYPHREQQMLFNDFGEKTVEPTTDLLQPKASKDANQARLNDPDPMARAGHGRVAADANWQAFLAAQKKKQGGWIDIGETADRVTSLLKSAKGLKEFTTRLLLTTADPGWRKQMMEIAGKLWEAKDDLIKDAENAPPSAKKARTITEGRTLGEVMEDIKVTDKDNKKVVRPLTKKEDIGSIARAAGAMPTMYERYLGATGDLIRSTMSQLFKHARESELFHAESVSHIKSYLMSSRKDQLGVMAASRYFDSGAGHEALVAQGLQWPSRDMLKAQGLSDKQVIAYEGLTRMYDKVYDLLDAMAELRGIPSPTKVPGYMPHAWVGAYRVFIRDADGNLAKILAFENRWQAKRAATLAERDGWNVRLPNGENFREPGGGMAVDFTTAANDAINAFHGYSKLDQAMKTRLNKIESEVRRNRLVHAMERRSGVEGFIGSEVGVLDKNMVTLPARYVEMAANYYKDTLNSSHILNTLTSPETIELLQYTPNLRNYLKELTFRNMEGKYTYAGVKWIDTAIDNTVKTLSFDYLDGSMVRSVIKGSNSAIYKIKLFPKLGYLISQPLQVFTGIPVMHKIALQDLVDGHNPAAVKRAQRAFYDIWRDSNIEAEAITYLDESKRLDPRDPTHQDPGKARYEGIKTKRTIYEHSKNVVSLEPLAAGYSWLEGKLRATLARGFTRYYDTLYGESVSKAAKFEMAMRQVDATMTSYAKGHQSGMYEHAGTIGVALKPFTSFRNNFIGNLVQTFDVARKAIVSGTPVEKLAGVKAITSMTVIPLVLAGAQGLILWQELNKLSEILRDNRDILGPLGMPMSLNDWLYSLKIKDNAVAAGINPTVAGVADQVVKHGSASSVLPGINPNWGPTVAAPSVSEGLAVPGLSLATDIGQAGIAAARGDIKGTYENARAAAMPLPGNVPYISQQWWENSISAKTGVTPKARSLAGELKRTPEQERTLLWTGTRSVSEEEERFRNREMRNIKKADTAIKARGMDKIAAEVLHGTPEGQAAATKKLLETVTIDPESFRRSLKSRIEQGVTEERVRELKKILNSSPATKARRMELYEQLSPTE